MNSWRVSDTGCCCGSIATSCTLRRSSTVNRYIEFQAPSAGMDAVARQGLRTLLRRERQSRSILLTTHFMDEADLLADSIAILAAGQLACHGPSLSLKARSHILTDSGMMACVVPSTYQDGDSSTQFDCHISWCRSNMATATH